MHGYYSGYKYQRGLAAATTARKEEMQEFTFTLLEELYALELQYSGELYEPLGTRWTMSRRSSATTRTRR